MALFSSRFIFFFAPPPFLRANPGSDLLLKQSGPVNEFVGNILTNSIALALRLTPTEVVEFEVHRTRVEIAINPINPCGGHGVGGEVERQLVIEPAE